MTVLSELISAWNEFATENSYPEIIYANDSFEEVVKQIYGDNLTPAKAVELVKQCTNGSYIPGHRWWWIQSDGNLGGCSPPALYRLTLQNSTNGVSKTVWICRGQKMWN
ncbi:MAG: hypothetical protein HXN28_08000 [Prevotella histicola]|uniref:hypothetical protein n=1 Tax=Prevotella histicola TaxID=470565 RepID=UPI001CB0B950|nr:hypothetical protein [Prevotella histicola]MBF1392500.1 hypothetical protein [Prevotella histicola]